MQKRCETRNFARRAWRQAALAAALTAALLQGAASIGFPESLSC
jgi:hypothetical protein